MIDYICVCVEYDSSAVSIHEICQHTAHSSKLVDGPCKCRWHHSIEDVVTLHSAYSTLNMHTYSCNRMCVCYLLFSELGSCRCQEWGNHEVSSYFQQFCGYCEPLVHHNLVTSVQQILNARVPGDCQTRIQDAELTRSSLPPMA